MATVLRSIFVFLFLTIGILSAELPGSAGGPTAISFDHFPSRLHTFVWRNWAVVPEVRLAEVLKTSVENVRRIATSLGLPPQDKISPRWESPQGYITVLRRNWHLLPYEQLLVLLNQTPEHLAESLREDDFLFVKLGSIKPQCEPIQFEEPTEDQYRHAQKIATWIKEELGDEWTTPEVPRFAFLDEFFPKTSNVVETAKGRSDTSPFEIRFLFSYFATFGDPLLDPAVASYPEELLRQLADSGVNGIWLHTLLRTLAPSGLFPEFGKDYEIRLRSLRTLVERADRYGIKVYLYMNEPRALPSSLFVGEMEKFAGVPEGNYRALCTSAPEVRQWLADSLSFIFREVPNLGGIFTISASENLTHCASHHQNDHCPRCKDRSAAEIIAEVNSVMVEAVQAANPHAKGIVWDWGWNDNDAPAIIEKLPKSCWFQSVSEWSLPIERGGVKSHVGEYSISSVGPGPRAAKHWELARNQGLKTVAKVQFNITWELAAIPYLPVADLVAEHASNLSESGVNGLMLSWSLGGWPSPNLEIAKEFQVVHVPSPSEGGLGWRETEPGKSPHPNPLPQGEGTLVNPFPQGEGMLVNPFPQGEETLVNPLKEGKINAVLDRVAANCYGDGAAKAREAWRLFSTGFREFPYNGGLCYNGPQQWGAANLFFAQPTGYRATMVGIPYDDVQGWCAIYPPDIAAGQFRKIADHFTQGLVPLREAVALAPLAKKRKAESEYRFADAARLHFAASANMIEFNTLRNRLLEEKDDEKKKQLVAAMDNVLSAELRIAKEMYRLAKSDAQIGYESSNHYFYIPMDIAEAIISARYVRNILEK